MNPWELTAAKAQGLEPHGTLGIISRAAREGIITTKEAIEKVEALHKNSTLFIATDLVEWAKRELKKFSK